MKNRHIFSQIVQLIDWDEFSRHVEAYKGDFAAKGITCKSQFIMMLFAQFAGTDSLREICQGMAMQGGNLNHMGIEKIPKRTSLAYANQNRDWRIYRDMFQSLVSKHRPQLKEKNKPGKYTGKLFSIDSTTIDLCLTLFPWAKFHHKKGAIKIHTVLDHDGLLPVFADVTHGRVHDLKAMQTTLLDSKRFPEHSIVAMDRAYVDYELFGKLTDKNVWMVTRQKENAVFKVIESYEVPKGRNIISDEMIQLTSAKGELCGYYMRRVVVWDERNQKPIKLLCNNLKFGASTIAGIYKERWQIELFFKQLKQNLKIKSFVGTSENAVKTQVYIALCAVVLLRHLKSISDSKRIKCKQVSFSFSNMVTMLRISLFRVMNLGEWLLNPFLKTPKSSLIYQMNLRLFGQQQIVEGIDFDNRENVMNLNLKD